MDDADAFINGVFAFTNNGKETRQDKENHRDQPSNNSMNDADDDDVFDDNSAFSFTSMNFGTPLLKVSEQANVQSFDQVCQTPDS
jgi:hypothetical protein